MPTPVYDIADYSPDRITSERKSFKLVDELRWLIDRPECPRSVLLPPEKVVLDYCNFDGEMGNGFRVLIGYCGGPETFARGLLAVKAIGATDRLQLMETAKHMMELGGLEFPDPLPEPWWDPSTGYDDLPPEVESDLDTLEKPYWHLKEDGCLKLLEYLQAHRNELSCRRGPPTDSAQT